ncbi:S8 family peptidase [Jatrophihabitans fulvus]
MRARRRLLTASTAAVGAVVLAGSTLAVAAPATAAPLLNVIVTLEPSANASATATSLLGGSGNVTHVYRNALNGFAGSLPETLLSTLRGDSRVVSVELDRTVRTTGTQSPTPSWGLDRIDQRALPANSTYTYNSTGSGVTAYVIDTGIVLGHPDFGGRAVTGYDAVDGGAAEDCNGHGTHVAGTIGGSNHGVAKQASLVAVRVLGCDGSGTNSGVIAGIDWVVGNHAAGAPAVANMSLGGTASTAVDSAINRLIGDGVTTAVAAGNDNADACKGSPSRVPNALTVGASGRTDKRASFSNVGSCVDLFAPGVDITSDWLDNGTNTISGTSMATPHVAGVAAQYLQTNPSASPSTVSSAVLGATTKDKVTDTAGGCTLFVLCTPATPNNDLLYTSF